MTVKEIFDSVQGLENLIYQINKREPEAIKELNKLHRLAFGEPVNVGCSNCHIKAYKKLLSLTLLDLENMENQKFKIKKDALIEYPIRSGQFYSSKLGIDDATAKKYLSEFPKMAKHFEVIPEDEPVNEKPLSKMNLIELQKKYNEVTGLESGEMTKKTIIEILSK
jgi:hypothetical protein